ncbi:MAG: efflux RND transporter periplasmic adaptor subunit [Sphaerochaetaceae bacterium]|nr:efflux RND transporter periplasmic adaptor subunit [Sphaerochaetaceae bacterium]
MKITNKFRDNLKEALAKSAHYRSLSKEEKNKFREELRNDIHARMRQHSKLHSGFLRYLALVIFALASFFGLRAFFLSRKPVEYVSPEPPVSVEKPVIRSLQKSIAINAYVEADAMIPVVPLVAGNLTEYYAQAGMEVHEGDLLAVVDPEPYRLQMAQAEAAYLGYENTFSRIEKLYESKAVSHQDYDTVKAQRDAYKAQWELAKMQLGYSDVTATVDGTILIAPQAKGSAVNSTMPVAVLADLDNLVVKVQVPEKYFTVFMNGAAGLKAEITRPGSDGVSEEITVPAQFKSIAPYVNATAKTFEVTLSLKNESRNFRPGMFVKAKIMYDILEGVPTMTQKAKKNDGSVYIYDPQTRKVSWIESVDLSQNDDYFEVPSNLAYTYFVTTGQGNLFDGQTVNAENI